MMVESVIEKFHQQPWQEFRDEELWTFSVDAVFKANLEMLKKIHEYLFPKNYNSDGVKNCIELITK